jgi:PAP_fibrillin
LSVSTSKLVLIHKANVESTQNPLKIGLSLKSVVLNVAGTSTFLDPNGKDITGINIPLGDFLNAGSFETTYMDGELRISRGKSVAGDQLRVFLRRGRVDDDLAVQEIKDGVPVGQGVDAELDVDEVVDPDFDNLAPSDVEDV